jgi:hypothetical protein
MMRIKSRHFDDKGGEISRSIPIPLLQLSVKLHKISLRSFFTHRNDGLIYFISLLK